MALLIWCPLTKDLHNQGLYSTSTASGTQSTSGGKLGSGYYSNISISNLPTATDFTICFWFYNSGSMSGNIPVIQDGSATTLSWGTNDYTSSGSGHAIKMSHTNNGPHWTYDTVTDSTGWLLDHWDHYTVIHKNGSSTTVQVYINGILKGDSTTAHNITLNSGTLTISNARINDFRLYDHCLTAGEVKRISLGLVLGILGNEPETEPTTNLGGYAATNADVADGYTSGDGNGWGGTTGIISLYRTGGHGGKPYMKYHRTANGSGGFYMKRGSFTLKNSTTYTMSCWIKGSVAYTDSPYNFCINGVLSNGSDSNHYITNGSSPVITTEWKRFVKTFTTTSTEAGTYGFMPIMYTAQSSTYPNAELYFSGFLIEEKDHVTPWTDSSRTGVCHDALSGLHNDLTAYGTATLSTDTKRYDRSVLTGTSAANYLYSPNPFTFLTSALSISFWVKTTGTGYMVSHGRDCGYVGWSVNISSGKARFYLGGLDSVSGQVGRCTSTTTVNDGNWHHIAGTWNGSTMTLYVDGKSEATASASTISYTQGPTLVIGKMAYNYTSDTYYFPVSEYLSDIRLYATALSAEDILTLYKLGNSSTSYFNSSYIGTI